MLEDGEGEGEGAGLEGETLEGLGVDNVVGVAGVEESVVSLATWVGVTASLDGGVV